MADPIEEYKAFVDGLLGWPRSSAVVRWIKEWNEAESRKTYQVPAEHPLYKLMPGLTPDQCEALCQLLQHERDSGIHETLTYLEPYTIVKDGVPLAVEPFGTEMHYDFVARREGEDWPAEPMSD